MDIKSLIKSKTDNEYIYKDELYKCITLEHPNYSKASYRWTIYNLVHSGLITKIGKNLFKESKSSGQAALGKPSESGRGEVLSKSVELSNVDFANEFVNLMTAQRNFQANAKTLTTADQMLQEVLQIKR